MEVCYYLLFLCACDVISGKKHVDEEDEFEKKRKDILRQLTITQTHIHESYHVVTRQLATDILKFKSYRSVTVLTYPIMHDTEVARFTFQAEEAHMNSIGSCDPQDVIVDIKYSSYPAVNPDGYDFPESFIGPSQREDIHSLQFTSDKNNNTYIIENPKPGNWYALAYIKWEDPKREKVKQAGLVPSCQTTLYTDLQVKTHAGVQFIDCYSGLTWERARLPAIFKCMTRDNNNLAGFNLTITDAQDGTRISVRIQVLTVPTPTHNILACAFDPLKRVTQKVTFSPSPSTWHYIDVAPVSANGTRIADCESFNLRSEFDDVDNYTIMDLMRDDKGRFFTFQYGLPTADPEDVTSTIALDSRSVTSIRFAINPYLDIGGTLTIGATILMSLKYYMGYKRAKAGPESGYDDENRFFKVVVCMDIGHTSKPLASGDCQYNDKVTKALFVLNSTDTDTIFDNVIIPYPEAGMWYLTFRLFCDAAFCPCPTTGDGRYYVPGGNETVVSNTTWLGEAECNATVLLSLESAACQAGKCSNHGRCQLNTYGGLVLSYCACNNGYGAWDCSDRSRMDGTGEMMLSVLLLTLSNLLFFLSVYVATIRRYYTEAIMYTFTMVFSTFYHACDANDEISMCIFQLNVLQFGDFYCGLMSFWTTLLAMALMNDVTKSSLQLVGAIVIALATAWNMHSIVSFLMPVAFGVAFTFGSWAYIYWRAKRMPFPETYYKMYLPMGVALVSVGLLCYAFLQTESNYKIVHSVWHMVIASSVVFLLPDSRRSGQRNAFVPGPDFFKCRRSATEPTTSDSATGSDQTAKHSQIPNQ